MPPAGVHRSRVRRETEEQKDTKEIYDSMEDSGKKLKIGFGTKDISESFNNSVTFWETFPFTPSTRRWLAAEWLLRLTSGKPARSCNTEILK